MINKPNNLPPTWRFSVEDYTSLGPTFAKFIAVLNLFTLAAYNLFNGGIGFQNLQRSIYSASYIGGATNSGGYALSFVNPLPVPPSGLTLCQISVPGKTTIPVTTAVCVASWFFDGKSINILAIAGLTTGTVYNISLEVF